MTNLTMRIYILN